MEKEFVPYELALELKKLGFFEECLGFYIWQSWNNNSRLEIGNDDEYTCETIKAPLYQQTFRFFREKYNLLGSPVPCDFNRKDTKFDFIINGNMNYRYLSYEEVKLECLKKLIEIAKEQNVK